MNNKHDPNLVEKLRSLCKDSYVVRELLSKIKKDTGITRVEEAENIANDTSRQEIINSFKALDRIGVGKFIPGRRGAPSRFMWRYSPRRLSEVVQGEVQEPCAIDEGNLENDKANLDEKKSRYEADWPDWIDHKFQLRPKLEITLRMPADLNSKEAERLAGFIQSVPFGE